ncbi:unnamed protein product [Darwinula stevensoni]|uniref:Major facilitator superfamily (MFS) profile domain-containing protein n=1 Tax=Darwinula stevensoni TaxID=69355 RepID=A0A7R9AGQ3_9CRUS|nr:unnamed protein product [Darwinula stevensoni]CAG0904670.1 unnamed protein product [Darwinula stevensoni]
MKCRRGSEMPESLPLLVERAAKNFYRRRLVTVVIGLVVAFAVGSENAIILPTAWKYLQSLGSRDETDFGILISAFNVGGLISSVFFGWLVDRRMDLCKRIVFVGAMIQIPGNVMYFLGIHKWFVISARFICGLGSGIIAVILAELARATSNEERTKYLTLGFGCRQLGLLFGPAYNFGLHDIHTHFGDVSVDEGSLPGLIFAIFWALALVAIFAGYENIGKLHHSLQMLQEYAKESESIKYGTFSSIPATSDRHPVASTAAREPEVRVLPLPSSTPYRNKFQREIPYDRLDDVVHSSFLDLLTDTTVVILFMQITFFFGQYMVETIIPPTMQDSFGLGNQENSLFYLLIGCEAILSFVFVILVRKRLLDRTVIMIGNVLIVIGLVSLMLTTWVQTSHPDYAFPFFISSCTFVFLGVPMASVSSVALASKTVGPESQGKMQALRRVASSVGLILGPLWAGAFVFDRFVLCGVTIIMFLIQIFLFVLSYARMIPK